MTEMMKPKWVMIGTWMARSANRMMAICLTVVLSSCGSIVGEVIAPTVTESQVGLGGKKISGTTTSSKQAAKEQEKLKEEGKCPACRGVGKSPDGQYECTVCKGTGKYTQQP